MMQLGALKQVDVRQIWSDEAPAEQVILEWLHAQFAQSAELEAQIRSNLEGLGYGG